MKLTRRQIKEKDTHSLDYMDSLVTTLLKFYPLKVILLSFRRQLDLENVEEELKGKKYLVDCD